MLNERTMEGCHEIIITETNVWLVRAGIGLLILPMTAILGLFGYLLGTENLHSVSVGVVGAAVGVLLGLFMLRTVAARISLNGGMLHILRSMDEMVIPASSIAEASIRVLYPSRWIIGACWLHERRWPVIFHFVVADRTNVGDLRATVGVVERLLQDVSS
jgi:hypothetical protein